MTAPGTAAGGRPAGAAGTAFTVAMLTAILPWPLPAQNNLPRLRLVEDLRLDADAEDFSVVNRVVVGPHGRMAVPLPQDLAIRLYDATGRRVAAVGRRGGGPGEFRHLGAMTWLGDTLVVDDQRQRRATYIDANGNVLGTFRLPAPFVETPAGSGASDSLFHFFITHAASPTGALLGIARVSVRGVRTRVMPTALVLLSRDGVARTIATPPQYADERWTITINGLSNRVPFAFQPQIVFAADGSRFAFMTADQGSRESTYSVEVFDAGGDTVFARRYPFRGIPIPASAADSAIRAMAPRPELREAGSNPARFQAAARQRMPAVYAPVEQLLLALDGTTWITQGAAGAEREVVILDALGTPTASVLLPPRTRVQQATATHVWVTESDSLGLTSVVRYRIVRPD